jgi:hypothetical protein
MKKITYGFLIISIIVNFGLAHASVEGNWLVTFFLEPTRSLGSTQCIAFKLVSGTVNGIPTSGTWKSPTFPGWSGQWIQHGDYIRWFGVKDDLASTASGFMQDNTNFGGISYNHFSTHDGSSITSGSWKAVRVAKCEVSKTLIVGKDPATDSNRIN